jgi:hypothetical protein
MAKAKLFNIRIYIDLDDWWVGYYRGPCFHYICILPTVVIRWGRKGDSQSIFISIERDWKIMLQNAAALAAEEEVEYNDLIEQLEDEATNWYVNDGDQENPDPDNVHDMIKDKELGL